MQAGKPNIQNNYAEVVAGVGVDLDERYVVGEDDVVVVVAVVAAVAVVGVGVGVGVVGVGVVGVVAVAVADSTDVLSVHSSVNDAGAGAGAGVVAYAACVADGFVVGAALALFFASQAGVAAIAYPAIFVFAVADVVADG